MDERTCTNCKYDCKNEWEFPCNACKWGVPPSKSHQYPLYWKSKSDDKDESQSVDHPSHYNQGNIECIDAMVAAYGKEATGVFCVLNAFKYLWRAEHKNGDEDLEKALWYLKKRLELNESE